VPFTFDSVLTWATRSRKSRPDRYIASLFARRAGTTDALRPGVGELVSYVCVRADHQWGTADSGQVHAKDGGLGWCPDASLDADERHVWRVCDLSPIAAAAAMAARLVTMESAVS